MAAEHGSVYVGKLTAREVRRGLPGNPYPRSAILDLAVPKSQTTEFPVGGAAYGRAIFYKTTLRPRAAVEPMYPQRAACGIIKVAVRGRYSRLRASRGVTVHVKPVQIDARFVIALDPPH